MRRIVFSFFTLFLSAQLFSQCLSGVYTIGGTTPDYATLNAAVSALNTNGVCGPVVFNIRPGVYNEQLLINPVTGASASNTITFESENNDSSSVNISWASGPSAATNYIVNLQGADHFRFYDLTFTRTGINGYGRIFFLNTTACDHVIADCHLVGVPTTINASNRPLIFSDYSIDSNIVIRDNTFDYGYQAVTLQGNGASFTESGNVVSHNICRNQYANGLELIDQVNSRADSNSVFAVSPFNSSAAIQIEISNNSNFLCRNNTVTGTWVKGIDLPYMNGYVLVSGNSVSGNSGTGISLNNCTGNFVVEKNNVNVPGLALNMNTCSGSSLPGALIKNNFIIGKQGAYLNGNNLRFYHNSIYANGTLSTDYALNVYVSVSSSDTVANNIICDTIAGRLLVYNPGIIFKRNFYYETMAYFGYSYFSGTPVTFAQYQSQTGDATSIVSLPPFLSATNLHIYYKPDYFGVDQLLPAVTDDIDGDVRNVNYPWPGADEFMYAPNDASATAVNAVLQASCSNSTPVIMSIQNAGSQPLTSVQINWSVDGILQAPYSWNGNLASLQFQNGINLGSFTIATNTRDQDVKIWTTMPNGVTDTLNLYDTIHTTFRPKLFGVYTVGGNIPDYVSVDTIITDLRTRGICSSVTFNFRPGIYQVSDTLFPVNGASASSTITFQSEQLDSSTATIEHTNGNVFYLDSADYFRINELTLKVHDVFSSTSDCHPVRLANGADHNIISNCRLLGDKDINTSGYAGQYASIYCPGGCNYNVYRGNYLSEGLVGIYLNHYSYTPPLTFGDTIDGNVIVRDTASSYGYGYGLEIYDQHRIVITGNTVVAWNCYFEQLDTILFAKNRMPYEVVFDNVSHLSC
ncbi:MAG TPA: hypothetical protein VL651_08550, partial [Bacteroidia bacterium]|nr:hypothetical protein [Bacteroidia bacterium]